MPIQALQNNKTMKLQQ